MRMKFRIASIPVLHVPQAIQFSTDSEPKEEEDSIKRLQVVL